MCIRDSKRGVGIGLITKSKAIVAISNHLRFHAAVKSRDDGVLEKRRIFCYNDTMEEGLTPRETELMLKDYRLTTAEIFYCFPDHPSLIQAYIWQELDLVPKFPELNKFLGFWEAEIEGKLHSVEVVSTDIIAASQVHWRDGAIKLH